MEVKNSNKKIPIIIGIAVLILIFVLIGVGYLLKPKTPAQVFESAIHEFADKMIENLDKSKVPDINFKQNDFTITGDLKVDTDYDLGEFGVLTNFNYKMQMDASASKKLLKLNLSMNENNKEVLSAKTYLQDEIAYLDIPGVLPYIVQLGEYDLDFSSLEEVENVTYDKEAYKKFIDETKKLLIQTLDQNKFSKNEKIEKEYNGKKASAVEYVYLLDSENQKRTIHELKDGILKNDEYLNVLSKISGVPKSEIQSSLNDVDDITYDNDIKIILTTTGSLNTPIALEIVSGDNSLYYVDYNDKISLSLEDLKLEYYEQGNDAIVNFVYDDYSGKFIIQESQQDNSKYNIHVNVDFNLLNNSIKLDLNLLLDVNANVKLENVQGAKLQDEFTEEEQGEILRNFLDKIDGTSLEELIESALMGLV